MVSAYYILELASLTIGLLFVFCLPTQVEEVDEKKEAAKKDKKKKKVKEVKTEWSLLNKQKPIW